MNLIAYALTLTHRLDAAEDLVQTAYLNMLERGDIVGLVSHRGYAVKVLSNLWKDTQRSHKRRIDRFEEDEAFMAIDHAPPVDMQADAFRVRAAIYKLDKPFRDACWLVYINEFTVEEAAQLLGVPIGTIKSRTLRGKQKLREILTCDGLH